MMSLHQEPIRIIRVQEEDYPEFCQLLEWRRTGQREADTSAYQTEGVKQFRKEHHVLNSNHFYIFAARQGDRFVGYINAVLIPKPDPRLGILHIDELWVPTEYRRHGIAEKLMGEVYRIAKEKDLWRVRLYVDAENNVGRNFYQKVGYEEKGDAIFCEVDVADIMVKEKNEV